MVRMRTGVAGQTEVSVGYPPELTEPMRQELVEIGVRDLRTPEAVDGLLNNEKGSVLLFVNSVCGCAAGTARPGLALALRHSVKPEVVATVFAGVDTEATRQARNHFSEYPPSSPQIALFRDGKLVEMFQRHQIEGRDAFAVADALTAAFDQHFAPVA
jgi:putative YphP/YqiW family bacilliredoxin